MCTHMDDYVSATQKIADLIKSRFTFKPLFAATNDDDDEVAATADTGDMNAWIEEVANTQTRRAEEEDDEEYQEAAVVNEEELELEEA